MLDESICIRHYRSMTSGGMEAVGDAVTGGLVARALEPGAGEGRDHGERICLNCGTGLVGPHCHNCGQAGHVHRTVMAWWHDFAHGILHLDGKIWRTLPLLAWRPGELTRRFIEGERATFVSPLALFLFSVFLMFAVFSALGAPLLGEGGDGDVRRGLAAELVSSQQAVTKLEAERRGLEARGATLADVDRRLRRAREGRDGIAAASAKLGEGSRLTKAEFKTGWHRLDKGIEKARANPDLLFYKLQTSAYKFSWALIPISVPFLWLLLLHRKRYRQRYKGYDHLVFITYSIAFMSLGLVAVVILQSIGMGGPWLRWAIMIVPPVHMYRQLRGAYRLSRFSALWRTAVLLFSCGVAITLFTLLLLALGVLA